MKFHSFFSVCYMLPIYIVSHIDHFTLYTQNLDQNLSLYTKFLLTLDGREQLHYLYIKSLERIPRPIFVARSLLSNSAKLLNLW